MKFFHIVHTIRIITYRFPSFWSHEYFISDRVFRNKEIKNDLSIFYGENADFFKREIENLSSRCASDVENNVDYIWDK